MSSAHNHKPHDWRRSSEENNIAVGSLEFPPLSDHACLAYPTLAGREHEHKVRSARSSSCVVSRCDSCLSCVGRWPLDSTWSPAKSDPVLAASSKRSRIAATHLMGMEDLAWEKVEAGKYYMSRAQYDACNEQL